MKPEDTGARKTTAGDFAVGEPETFKGLPWNAGSADDWNCPSYWRDYYTGLLGEADRLERVVHREVDHLIWMLGKAGELPRSSPQTLLDAGCGIALVPHVLAFWGFQVTAIDSCPRAIEIASTHRPSEKELAKCVPIWNPCEGRPGSFMMVEDPARSLRRLHDFSAPGGAVSYVASDWLMADRPLGPFGVVHCRNSLRCSTKPYWRQSLRQFHELLSPGGVLLLQNVNSIQIKDEVEQLLAECEFVPLGVVREPSSKYVNAIWPT